jgi:cytoskeletal protein CcmA (bactofilin family)
MFSKSKPSDPVPQPSAPPPVPGATPEWASGSGASSAPRSKTSPSVLSPDLTITGNVQSTGDIQVEGTIDGDLRAAYLTVGDTATIKGEIVADEVVVHGRVVGRIRGSKIRLSASARVEGDIVHKTIAIESGAHFEGSVQRQDDPVGQAQQQPPRIAGPRDVTRSAAKPVAAETVEAAAPAAAGTLGP